MKTAQQYIESLRKVKPELYYMGEKIEDRVDHPAIRPHINAAAETYQMAHEPQFQSLFTTTSHLTGDRINRFTHIHQSSEDLITKVKMLRAAGQRTGSCFQRCAGFDAMNALYGVTYEVDKARETDYHPRFVEFLRYIQANDLMPGGAMTDSKGDRSLPPAKQADPDQYLHVVEKRKNGIVVRGAKVHQTGAVNSHEIIVVPTRALGPDETDWAVAFSVPADTKGMIYFFGRQGNDNRKWEDKIDQGNPKYGVVGGEALIVFEDVFVPWERVFLYGETDFAGLIVERFTALHRQNYGGCKVGVADVLIGATVALAEYQGTLGASHVRDKIVEMVHLSETLYSSAIACSCLSAATPSGAYWVEPLLANVTKHNVTRFVYEIDRLAQDLAGGLLATLPSERDLHHPKVGKYVDKYFSAVAGVPTEYRFRLARLIENMTGTTAPVESMHGAGSPQTQRVVMARQANLEAKKKLALKIAGIPEK